MLGAVLAALAAVSATAGPHPWLPLALTALLAWRVIPPFWAAMRVPGPGPIRRAVRTGVLSLVLLDAVLAAAYAGIIYVLAVLATAVLASGLAKRFAVT
jgi:4-hydroxybenzoate polyprenyltransferase